MKYGSASHAQRRHEGAPVLTTIRSYLAGTGASGSLVAAAVVAMLSVAAFVSFDELPFGTSERDASLVELETDAAVGPQPASAAVGGAGEAVAAIPASGAAGPGTGARASSRKPGGPGRDRDDRDPRPRCPSCPRVVTDPPPPPGGNPVNHVLGDVDRAARDRLGMDPGLRKKTKRITDALDGVLKKTTGRDLRETLDGLPPVGH